MAKRTRYVFKYSRAQKAFIDAFVELYAQKPIEKITVDELANLADYSRSTFYSYYSDIYALRREVENHFLMYAGLLYDATDRQVLLDEFEGGITPTCLVCWFERCLEWKDFLRAAMGAHGNLPFIRKIHALIREGLQNMFDLLDVPKNEHALLILERETQATYGVLRYAVFADKSVPPPYLANVMDSLRRCWIASGRDSGKRFG